MKIQSTGARIGATNTHKITAAALLIAIGIAIPIISPFKIWLEPASFTLASHVAIFIAMFIDPLIAIAVAIGTAISFFSLSIVVALRASSHLVFVIIGGLYLRKHPEILFNPAKVQLFAFLIALIHAAGEMIVVSAFYFGGSMTQYTSLQMVFLLIGLGSVVHSMVDFEIALVVYRALCRQKGFAAAFMRKAA
ncbi:MAG: hypothetical protein LBH39_02935 [Clostridiales Family XIII bacterium]|jgi:niacin transporter|nr:hypothetical protein [Clostridiales Family XIII bacterium]